MAPANRVRKLVTALCCAFLWHGQLAAGQSGPQAPGKSDLRRALKLAEAGEKAEAAGHLEEALMDYHQAALLAPGNSNILARNAALRSRLIRGRVALAEQKAIEGDLRRATELLAEALRIDPGNTILAERLKQMETMQKDEDEGPLSQPQTGSGIPELKPAAGRQNFNLRGDTRTVYEQVALAFGIKAAFDPDLASRNVRFRTDDVSFWTAAYLLGTQTKTFWRPVNATLMFVAEDNQEKHKQYGIEAEQTFGLPSSAGPEDMTEALRMVREITGATHAALDAGARTITMRDSPDKLKLAGEIIRQIERGRGEVLLEIEFLEVDKNVARKLGITPPATSRLVSLPPNVLDQLKNAKDLSTLTTLIATVFGGVATGGVGAALIPPLVPVGGGKSTFLLTVPSVAADFSDGLSLVQSGRQVFLRAQEGKPATFFVGDRFPVTLSLLSSSLGATQIGGAVSNVLLPRTDLPVGKDPVALIVRDINGDGQPDVAVANKADNSLSIFLNQGGRSGILKEATGSPILLGARETGPVAIASAVLRANSSAQDLLVANSTSGTVSVLLGNGDGTFTAAASSPITVGHGPSAIVTGDFNRDGNQDFLVTNFVDNTYSVFFGDGTGKFTQQKGSPFALPSGTLGPTAIASADLNGDGRADLAIVNRTTNNVTILVGQSDGTFLEAAASPIPVGKTPVAVAASDLNGDARPDLAVVNQADNTLTVLLNNGDATFTVGTGSPLATGTTPTGVAIADFNNDGIGDIVVTNQDVDSVSFYLGLGAGLLTRAASLPTAAGPSAIALADMNQDGFPDAVVTEATANEVSVIFSPTNLVSGGGASTAQQPYPGSEYIDLGVKVKATPALHDKDEVTLQLEIEIRALAGTSVNGIPVISNRTLNQTVRLKENEPAIVGGLTDTEETKTITGLPGFADVPGANYIFGKHDRTLKDTELLILVTPRRMRPAARDAQSIFAGRGEQGRNAAGGANTEP